jgi:hypothetical protein
MTEWDDANEERDVALVRRLCQAADTMRSALREWIQEELKDLCARAQIVETASSGTMKRSAARYVQELKEMDIHDLPEITKALQVRIDEMHEKRYDHPFDAQMYLEEAVYRLERLARVVFQVRRSLNALETSSEADEPLDDYE